MMITINFQTPCRDADHCQNIEEIRERLKNGDLTSAQIREMFKKELAGCCGSCDKKEEQSVSEKLFKV